MRRSVLILAVMAAVVLGAAVPAMADELVGELVDSACYATLGPRAGRGADHAKCAIACAQKGHRLALVTETGDVYMVTGALTQDNNAKLIPLMNRKVVLTGTVGVRVRESDVQDGAAQGDGRRMVGSQDGVVTKRTVRKGDVREGDVRTGVVMIIEAISVELAALRIR